MRPAPDADGELIALALKRRLVVESAIWAVAMSAWVGLTGSSGLLIFASVVAPRPGLGTPELGVARAGVLASPAA